MSNQCSIAFEISSNTANVKMLSPCIKALAQDHFNREESFNIELALIEAVNNCIEHAYAYAHNQLIRIEIQVQKSLFTIKIIDSGKSMPEGLIENTKTEFDYDLNDTENLPEGSFGLTLIKNSMHNVSYERREGSNILIMEKKINEGNKVYS